jgi:hypothetical protein
VHGASISLVFYPKFMVLRVSSRYLLRPVFLVKCRVILFNSYMRVRHPVATLVPLLPFFFVYDCLQVCESGFLRSRNLEICSSSLIPVIHRNLFLHGLHRPQIEPSNIWRMGSAGGVPWLRSGLTGVRYLRFDQEREVCSAGRRPSTLRRERSWCLLLV